MGHLKHAPGFAEAIEAYVRERIGEYPHERDAKLSWHDDHVRRHRALPLLIDWTMTIGLTEEGRLIEWSTDEEPPWCRDVDEPRVARLALAQGAKAYSGLLSLVPSRSSDADDCPSCGGTGSLSGANEAVICRCGGLGWLPADEIEKGGAR